MKSVMRRIVFICYLTGLFIIHSCTSPDQNLENEQGIVFEPIILLINNDSIISINGLEINFSELDFQLNQVLPNAGDRSHVTIKPDLSVMMSTIYAVEVVLASKSVQEITYLRKGKSIKMRLVPAVTNQIKLELTKEDELIFENIQIKSDEELLLLIQSLTEGMSNPLLVVSPQVGVGYNSFVKVKDRVQELLLKHGSTIKLGEVSYDLYERIE